MCAQLRNRINIVSLFRPDSAAELRSRINSSNPCMAEEITTFGVQYGLITGKGGGRPGHWYSGERLLGETKAKAKTALNDDPELMSDLKRQISKLMSGEVR